MAESTKRRRKGMPDRILEANRKQRKGLADRIREASSITRTKLKESAEILSSSALTHPEEPVDEKYPSSPVSAPKDEQLPEKDVRLSPSAETVDERAPSPPVSSPLDDELSERQVTSSDLVQKSHGFANLLSLRNRVFEYVKAAWIKVKKIFNLFSSRKKVQLHSDNGLGLKVSIRKAFRYAEIHRLREKITNELQEKNQKTVVITSPHDGTGNTFLTSVLAVNAVSFSSMEVLIVDMNTRKPQLHLAFDLDQELGFTDVVKGSMDWKDVVKDTDLEQLKVITFGQDDMELARHLNRPNLENLINKMKKDFDLILLDTSPILSQNRNNVDPALLSIVCDKVLIEIQGKKTTKNQLDEAFTAITQGGGKVDGIIYNQQFGSLL